MASDVYAEKGKRLRAAYEAFIREMDGLKKERFGLAKRIIGRIEQKKIKELLERLK